MGVSSGPMRDSVLEIKEASTLERTADVALWLAHAHRTVYPTQCAPTPTWACALIGTTKSMINPVFSHCSKSVLNLRATETFD